MFKNKIKKSLALRLVIIAIFTLALLIPSAMIQSLIKERKLRRDSATHEVSNKWGNAQTLSGPILTIPFHCHSRNDSGQLIATIKYAHFLPESLSIAGTIRAEIRYRGIYEAVLYNAKLQLRGTFSSPDFEALKIPAKDMVWEDALLSVGITDMKGIKDTIGMQWNDLVLVANPGIASTALLASGVSFKTPLAPKVEKFEFSSEIHLNGSKGLMFTPVGKETEVKVSSDWSNPSFSGNFIPDVREVSSGGFNALWKVWHVNRNYPQAWIGDQYKIASSAFGVNLLLSVDEYQKTMRTAKYAVMFIALTFLSFFIIELISRKVIHPIQYLLIGFALLVFYTLLLSFSEHIAFKYAYSIASVGVLILITAYTKSVLSNKFQTFTISGILTALYGYLYIVLQLQDYAFLMGSLGLFAILACVMYLTRKVDWFSTFTVNESLVDKVAEQ